MDELDDFRASLYCDQDVPVLLAELMRAHGFNAITTRDAGLLGAEDPDQLAYAVANGRAFVTHNRIDFENLYTEYALAGSEHFGILIGSHQHSPYVLRDRLLELLGKFDRDQLRDNIFYF
jgi:Uncharacterized protein conserved in bacteria